MRIKLTNNMTGIVVRYDGSRTTMPFVLAISWMVSGKFNPSLGWSKIGGTGERWSAGMLALRPIGGKRRAYVGGEG